MTDKSVKHIELLLNDASFRLWCLDKADAETNHRWNSWAAKNGYRREIAETAKKIILELEGLKSPIPAGQKYKAWKKLTGDLKTPSSTTNFSDYRNCKYDRYLGWKFSAAASIAILLILYSLVIFTNFGNLTTGEDIEQLPAVSAIETDFGEKKYISLSDGSRIILNANSSLTHYDGWHVNKKVKIRLEGEAHFTVAERTSKNAPVFQVETGDGNIRVLGTRFVVSTRDNTTKVILEKGSIAIDRPSSNTSRHNDVILQPNHIAEFSKSSDLINIESVNTQVYTSWIKDILVFDKTPLSQVAKRIEHTYGKEVLISDSAASGKKLSGSIESNSIEVVISALSKTLQTPIAQVGEKIIIGESQFQALSNSTSNSSHNP